MTVNRQVSVNTLYVPTLTAPRVENEPRHILTHRDGNTVCGRTVTDVGQGTQTEQVPPAKWHRKSLCVSCVQKYVRRVLEETDRA